MDFLDGKINDYIEFHSENEPPLLQQLSRETWQKILQPRMLSGHYQGRVLSLLSKLVRPSNILEIGTYTGYSALCLAEGLQANGILHTIDINEELYDFQKKYFEMSEFRNNIKQHLGDALDIIPKLNGQFDLVFIDADKSNYPNYFDLVIDRISAGGILISDNVLWSGKVLEKIEEDDIDTKALVKYNLILKNDSRVETVILPIRDGLTISRKKS